MKKKKRKRHVPAIRERLNVGSYNLCCTCGTAGIFLGSLSICFFYFDTLLLVLINA